MATYSSVPAWEISWTEEPSWLHSMVLQELDMTYQINNHHYRPIQLKQTWVCPKESLGGHYPTRKYYRHFNCWTSFILPCPQSFKKCKRKTELGSAQWMILRMGSIQWMIFKNASVFLQISFISVSIVLYFLPSILPML